MVQVPAWNGKAGTVVKIMITGADGFAASRMIRAWQDRHEITGTTRSMLDFTDWDGTCRKIRGLSPELVIHCGAVSDLAVCDREPESSRKVNVEGAENVAAACRESGSRMVLFSTDQVYFGGGEQGPHREEEPLSPRRLYGKQKLEAEERCRKVLPDVVILRMSWMFDYDKNRPGEHDTLVTSVRQALREGSRLQYPVYDFRSITYVGEMIRHLEKAIHLPGGIYNFGSPNEKSTYEVAEELLRLLGYDADLLAPNQEAFADKPRDLRLSQDKLLSYGIRFEDTQEGLKECLLHKSSFGSLRDQ